MILYSATLLMVLYQSNLVVGSTLDSSNEVPVETGNHLDRSMVSNINELLTRDNLVKGAAVVTAGTAVLAALQTDAGASVVDYFLNHVDWRAFTAWGVRKLGAEFLDYAIYKAHKNNSFMSYYLSSPLTRYEFNWSDFTLKTHMSVSDYGFYVIRMYIYDIVRERNLQAHRDPVHV